jgi:hypothetical protein
MTTSKYKMIYNWKKRGLIYDDYDALYEVYINTMECQHCESEFTKNNCRCLDHDHATGIFRKIVCNRCNTRDNYIKFPQAMDRVEYTQEWYIKNKERIAEYQKKYQERNRESILKYKNQKVKCECGCIVTMSNFSTHKKSKKHIKYIAGYI